MPKKQTKEVVVNAKIRLDRIELLHSSINKPNHQEDIFDKGTMGLHFDLNFEGKIDRKQKSVVIVIHVSIKSNRIEYIYGSVIVSYSFLFDNFDEVIKIDVNDSEIIPESIANIVHSISISTTRGIMFEQFRGTFLHNAVLPILNPASIQIAKVERQKA